MLYNYYTSAVVGDLLSIPVKGPSTIKEIIDSPLILSFEDIAYHKIIFKEYNTTLVKEMYKKKVWRRVILVFHSNRDSLVSHTDRTHTSTDQSPRLYRYCECYTILEERDVCLTFWDGQCLSGNSKDIWCERHLWFASGEFVWVHGSTSVSFNYHSFLYLGWWLNGFKYSDNVSIQK